MPKSEVSVYKPASRFTNKFPDISGNAVNGLGEKETRRPSPFFWHPPDRHKFGELQQEVLRDFHNTSEVAEAFYSPEGRGPRSVAKADRAAEKSEEEWSKAVKQFVLKNEGDLVGITRMQAEYVYEGYEDDNPWIIVVGVGMDYGEFSKAPASVAEPAACVEVGRQYSRAARVAARLRNFILDQGYEATSYKGPDAKDISMMPAAIACGFGELGKHGSLINRHYGSNFRLSAVTTNLPLVADQADEFGADDFCTRCQVCTRACPPDAIFSEKQWVRGVEKWYVDFDKCIPYFGETLGCGICIARCPWSRPGVAPRLAEKMTKRKARKLAEQEPGK